MPDLRAVEVIPKALVRERLPATPRIGSNEALAKRIIQKADEIHWKDAVGELGKKSPVEENRVKQRIDEIGITRDSTTGLKARTPAEKIRYDNADKAAKVAQKYLEGGYDRLSTNEKRNMRDAALREAMLRPRLAAELNGMTNAQKLAFAERVLRDPRFAGKSREIFDELTDPERKLLDPTETQDKKEKADRDLEDAKAEQKDQQRLWEVNDKRLAQYEERRPSRGAAPQKGAKLQEVERIDTDIQTTQTSLTTEQTNLRVAQDAEDRLQGELAILQRQQATGLQITGGRPITTVQQEYNQAVAARRTVEEQVTQHEARMNTLKESKQTLDQEHEQLLERRKELDTEKRQLDRKVKDAEREATKAQWELQDQQIVRTTQEEDLVKGFQNVFAEATNRILTEDVERLETIFNDELEVMKTEAVDKQEKAFYSTLQERWLAAQRVRFRGGLFGIGARRETYRPTDRAMVDGDFSVLMEHGPDTVMRQILAGRNNPETNRPYTPAEINALLSNKDFAEKMQPQMVKELIRRRLISGTMAQEDIDTIASSSWGEGMITAAIEKNHEVRTAIEQVMGEGALGRHGFMDRLRQELRKHPWWLLAILAGAIALPLSPVGSLFGVGGVAAGVAGIATGPGARAAQMSPLEEEIAA